MSAETKRLDNGTNPNGLYKDDKEKVPRSYFDISRLTTTTGELGALIPMDLVETLPGDSFELGNEILIISANPMVRRVISQFDIFVHYYYVKNQWLWEGWKNYITTGRRGKINMKLPYTSGIVSIKNTKGEVLHATTAVPMGLGSYLGVPALRYVKSRTKSGESFETLISPNQSQSWLPYATNADLGSESSWNLIKVQKEKSYNINDSRYAKYAVNALPFAMYQRIYRDYYMNKNLMQDNTAWFPENEDDFILPYTWDGYVENINSRTDYNTAVANQYNNYSPYPTTRKVNEVNQPTSTEFIDMPTLCGLRYRQWRGDYFTTALPWLTRGDEPNMNLTLPEDSRNVEFATEIADWVEANVAKTNNGGTPPWPTGTITESNAEYKVELDENKNLNIKFRNKVKEVTESGGNMQVETKYINQTEASIPIKAKLQKPKLETLITANDVRELIIMSVWKERNANTNGDYNNLIKAHFNKDPKSEDRKPIYIGGTRQTMQFSEVLQTSETNETPLGTQAGRAVSIAGGNAGKFTCDDYGYIMAIMSIVPKISYSRGMPKELDGTRVMTEQYYPEFNGLEPEAIKKRQIFWTNEEIDKNDETKDLDVFAYQQRYSYYRTREDRFTGNMALPSEVEPEYAAFSFSRELTEDEINFNPEFVTMNPLTMRRDMFTVPSEPEFIIQFASRVKAVRPMPVESKPASLINV